MKNQLSALFMALGLTFLWACSPTPTAPTSTNSGPVEGIIEQGIAVYRGIPYAAAPVGNLRWQAPAPVAAWSEPLKTQAYGPACWQVTDAGDSLFLSALTEGAGMGGFTQWLLTTSLSMLDMSTGEDCLTLNVLAPENAEGLPVMFWIHGGGHQFGSGGNTYESLSLADRGVVLVTINYRLGIYGFMAHPDLAAEDNNGSSGNYGMLDQIAALQWVQNNISNFGGDPANVTIFGESAGGHSVGQLMASPLSSDLFHKAIAQSGTGFYQFQATDAAHERISGFDAGRKVAELAGVSGADEIEKLRNLSVDELKEIALNPLVNSTFHPQIDGYVLTEPTALTFQKGQQHAVPLIVGSNADEGSVLYHMGLNPIDGANDPQPTTVAGWEKMLNEQFGDQAAQLDHSYSVDGDQDVVKAAEQLMGDSWFGRHAFYMAQTHSANGHPTYLYFYQRHPPTEGQTIGASHALELNHVFGGFIPFWPTDERDDELSAQMQLYWSTFATTGSPNADGLPTWPDFNQLNPQELSFGHEATLGQPVARADRYRAMQQQLTKRISAATPTATSTAGD